MREELRDRVAACERRWALRVGPPFPDLSHHFVAPALRTDGSFVVLKLGSPNAELSSEIEALRFFGGRGAVRLLDADPDLGMLLLERLEPGVRLSTLGFERDDEATLIASDLMSELWRPPPAEHRFFTLERWTHGLERMQLRWPDPSIDRAVRVREELLLSLDRPVVLHGDLHHHNILRGERAPWLAIDPKGVVGEPAYELASFLYNPPDLFARTDLARLVARRVDLSCERLSLDRTRVLGWALVQSFLSAWWSFEDSGRLEVDSIEFAKLIAELSQPSSNGTEGSSR